MNDSKDPKSLPPDDFSATIPNIPKPRQNSPSYESSTSTNDWEKTNYNYVPPKEEKEDWNKTAYNTPAPAAPPSYPPADTPPPVNYGNQSPSAPAPPSENIDWQMTQQNLRIPTPNPSNPTPPAPNQYQAQETMYGATKPLIDIPDEIRRQYQITPPPTPTEQKVADDQRKKEEKKGGIPVWLWALGAVFIFLLIAVVFGALYYLLKPKEGFIAVISNAPAGSDIRYDNVSWNIRSDDGTYRLLGLKAGETKKIQIIKEGFVCDPIEVRGNDGETKNLVANCSSPKVAEKPVITEGCDPTKFSKNDIKKSHDCAYEKLRALKPDFTVQQLLEAMNLYIINFDSGKFNIKPEDAQFMEEAAGYMKKLPPNIEIEVGGHTDNVGNDASNMALSTSRANSVKATLEKAGVKSEILFARGFGKSKPKDTNDTEDGRFRNRRIEYSAIIR